LNQQIITDSDF